MKAALEPVGAYSPRPSSPSQEIRTHTTDDRTGMRTEGRGRGRKRTASWSVGDDRSDEKEDLSVWKAITEQLQRLVSKLMIIKISSILIVFTKFSDGSFKH